MHKYRIIAFIFWKKYIYFGVLLQILVSLNAQESNLKQYIYTKGSFTVFLYMWVLYKLLSLDHNTVICKTLVGACMR